MSVIVKFKKYPELGRLKVVSPSICFSCEPCAFKGRRSCHDINPPRSCGYREGYHYERMDNVKDRA